jgi:hypothetical protein
MDEMNLLSLIKPWLDTNYQITTKSATVAFRKIFQELNKPLIIWVYKFQFVQINAFQILVQRW